MTDGRVVFYTCGASTFIINALGASALKLWLKANAGTSCSTSGCALSSWADQSGLANNGSGRATSPTYISQRWNFNPAIRFISGDFITANNGGIQGNMSMIAVYSTTQSAGDATFWNSPALIG